MAAEQIVIVGAGPAGLATARSYREAGGDGSVMLLGQETHAPYERPPLTKGFLRGELDVAELALEEEDWFGDNRVDLRLGKTVTAIDSHVGEVSVEGGPTLAADAIVLATGSEPLRPDVPGLEHPSVMTMRTLPDSIRLAERTSAGEKVSVIGMGFIGCEIAASLAMREARVTLIGQELLPQLERLGADAARRIAGWLEELEVELVGGVTVSAVHGGGDVELDDGSIIRASSVVLGMGVRPRGELAEAAGLEVRDGAIVVDDTMRSPARPGTVLAVGDVARAHNASAGRALRVEHWGDALEQGDVAGRSLAGEETSWRSVPGFWSTIGEHTLKYAAWGDGYEQACTNARADGSFTVWYSHEGRAVGVLTHDCDEDYERGRELIEAGEASP
jgi:NADPH-dependent 2,4-dienoyl-CoA reductase/sulfur reductase-like enzyme